jgi:hypothetical protein
MTRIRSLVVAGLLAASTLAIVRGSVPPEIGAWTLAGSIADARTGAAAVTLADGRTLMTGGTVADGSATGSAVIYDPIANAFASAGDLIARRVGHTATLLDDGRVVVSGGTIDGAISADIEIFDPATGTSVLVASLSQPRAGHAAARLADGSVLIVGGSTADGVVLQSAEIFNPADSGVAALRAALNQPRTGASATTLIDGRVLVAGGRDGSTDLGSAELYYPVPQTFAPVDTVLSLPRSGHTAILLPHNAGVLIAGGTANEAAVTTSDLFLPAIFPDPFSWGVGQFALTGAMTTARARAVGGPAGDNGYAFAAGGGPSDAEWYRFATIKTDKDDYAPGELAVITGSGWVPGEEVTLLFQEDPAVHADYSFTVTADGDGNIYLDQWGPEPHDFGVRFYLTATDSRSRAQTTFTDARAWTISVSPPSVATSTTNTFTFVVDNTSSTNGQGDRIGCVRVTLPSQFTSLTNRLLASAPSGWQIGGSGQIVFVRANANNNRFGANDGTFSFSVEATAPASTTGSPFSISSLASNEIGSSAGCTTNELFPAPTGGEPSVTVTAAAPKLTVTKVVDNTGGGTKAVGDFPLFVDGNGVASGVQTTVSAGPHTVSETPDPTYTAVIGGDCGTDGSITLAAGDVKSCTITNTFKAPKLTVTKVVLNDHGGTGVPGNWTLAVTSSNGGSGVGSAPGSGTGTAYTLEAGKTYSVAESGGPSGYSASKSTDCTNLVPTAGGNYTCTIINDDIQPKLIVIKHVVNDHFGLAAAGNFTMSVSGQDVSPGNFAGAEAPGTMVGLDAGPYTVSETGPSGYARSDSADCSGMIAIGQTKTCTVTNDDIAPTGLYLDGTGPASASTTLIFNQVAPTGTSPRSEDSAGINFNNGNPWVEVGTWSGDGDLVGAGTLHLWLGLKNSDDQGTNFDVRAELYKGTALVAGGEALCIQGLTRNANLAKEAILALGTFTAADGDAFSLKILTRIGTNGGGAKCGGQGAHNNAVGLRVYFDSANRPARLNAVIQP